MPKTHFSRPTDLASYLYNIDLIITVHTKKRFIVLHINDLVMPGLAEFIFTNYLCDSRSLVRRIYCQVLRPREPAARTGQEFGFVVQHVFL